MGYFIHKTLLFAAVSISVVTIGFLIVDLALRTVLRLRKRLLLYFGVAIVILGLMPVGIQLLENEEWRIVKLSADYHDTINYHRERRKTEYELNGARDCGYTVQRFGELVTHCEDGEEGARTVEK